jgi:hypothetical protein
MSIEVRGLKTCRPRELEKKKKKIESLDRLASINIATAAGRESTVDIQRVGIHRSMCGDWGGDARDFLYIILLHKASYILFQHRPISDCNH